MNIQTKELKPLVTARKVYWTEKDGITLEYTPTTGVIHLSTASDRFMHVSKGYIPESLFKPEVMTLIKDFLEAVDKVMEEERIPSKFESE